LDSYYPLNGRFGKLGQFRWPLCIDEATQSTNVVKGLGAVMDWYTRKVLAWRISNTLEADFCVEALSEAIHLFGPPEVMNTDSHMMVTSSRAV
jgi:transposase InsO family protein